MHILKIGTILQSSRAWTDNKLILWKLKTDNKVTIYAATTVSLNLVYAAVIYSYVTKSFPASTVAEGLQQRYYWGSTVADLAAEVFMEIEDSSKYGGVILWSKYYDPQIGKLCFHVIKGGLVSLFLSCEFEKRKTS